MDQSDQDSKDIVGLALRDAMTYCNVLIKEAETEEDKSAFEKRKIIYQGYLAKLNNGELFVGDFVGTGVDVVLEGGKNDLHSNSKRSNEVRNFNIAFNIDNSNRIHIQSASCESTTTSESNIIGDSSDNKSDRKRKVRVKPKTTVRRGTKSGLRGKDNVRKSSKVQRRSK